jgi:hypothetical protein
MNEIVVRFQSLPTRADNEVPKPELEHEYEYRPQQADLNQGSPVLEISRADEHADLARPEVAS